MAGYNRDFPTPDEIARQLERYLRHLAEIQQAPRGTGDSMIRIARWQLTQWDLEDRKIAALLDEWKQSDAAAWVIGQCGDIECHAWQSPDALDCTVLIAARVSPELKMEWDMRWR